MIGTDDRAGGASSPTLLEGIEITKRHPDDVLALDAVSLSVQAGQIYCLLGAAGAGKTLLLHTFLGLVPLTTGRVLLNGIDVARDPLRGRSQVTYIPRGASLYRSLTARENVEFFTRVDGHRGRLSRADYYNAMRKASIPERYFERPARELGPAVSISVWLAIGLLKNTSVLLIDEPTVCLDLHATADLREFLDEFRARGRAMLIATSDLLFAGAIADRVGILQEGRKRVELSRGELAGRSLPELYLEYLGRPFPVKRPAAGIDASGSAT
jgi:ABC-2 type transport system ATP-binding protein